VRLSKLLACLSKLSASLSEQTFLAELQRRRAKKLGAWTPAVDKLARDVWREYGQPAKARQYERVRLEAEVARLVEEAYGLTEAEVRLLWETAPPRMPASPPEWLKVAGQGGVVPA